MDCNQYDLEGFMKELIDLKNDRNSLIILRVNIIDVIEVVSKIKLESLTIADLKKRMKQIKSNCIQI